MSANNFNKNLLTRYIESECERRLLYDLSKVKPEVWYTDVRKIIPPKRIRKGTKLVLKLGKKYEQNVYSHLILINEVKCNKDVNGNITDTYFNPKLFLDLYYELKASSFTEFIVLEYQYDVPDSFFLNLLPPKSPGDEIPVNFGDQRPDIIIISKYKHSKNEKIRELLPDGKIRKVPASELDDRFGINIIDVKNICEENIGKKQFIEIFYYMSTLSYYLKENKLDDKFFIHLDKNGIFPQLNDDELNEIKSLEDIYQKSIIIKWEESNQVYFDIIKTIKKLWQKCPCLIESTQLNIQPSCGYCFYIEDCKYTLGIDNIKPPKDWSLKLIPYTSMSIAQQLLKLDYKTINDVAENIGSIKIGNTPEPIYPELPLIELKAKALVNERIEHPKQGHVHAYSIPKYSSISLNFAVEKDPSNERVYIAGFYLDMSTSPKSPFSGVFDNWWRVWKNALNQKKTPIEIRDELNEYLIRKISLEKVEYILLDILKNLKILIYLKGEQTKAGTPRKSTRVIYQYAAVNKDYTEAEEEKFTKKIIEKMFYIFELCNMVENFTVTTGFYAGTYYGPATSLFYWSRRQLNNLQSMFERNLPFIISDFHLWRKFTKIISLFTPSDSEVVHPYQHKKLFNVQKFAETIHGFPTIISYTWHEIANKVFPNKSFKSKYWIPHFNFMDFNNWYEMILEEDPAIKKTKRTDIRKQLMYKLRTINDLRRKFQIESRFAISRHARTISDKEFRGSLLPSDYHSMAQVWYLFSKLTGSIDEMNAEFLRTIYPEFSIGKLSAAKVSKLKRHSKAKKCYYTFQLEGLSSNMKINEGNRVLLIPNEKRDIRSNYKIEAWKVTIDKMKWDSRIEGYFVVTGETRSDLYEKIQADKDIMGKPEELDWYLFPTSLDVWSKRLYYKNGLLQRCGFGSSWLGARFSFLWKLRSKQELKWPKKWQFNTPPIYLYAPKLLIDSIASSVVKPYDKLLTPIYPAPDPSQKGAINMALNNIISGIRGPPGTGKSQTIVALIDEYYHQRKAEGNKSVKILVTCFSYAALRVIIEKIQDGKDEKKNPTKSSKMQIIFLRSEYQEPIKHQSGRRIVNDLVRYGTTWKLNGESHSVTQTKLLDESLERNFIIFGNAHQLYHLTERVNDDFAFDLICVDEASQLPVDHFMSSLQFVYKHKIYIKKPKLAGKPKTPVQSIDKVKDLVIENEIDKELLTKIVIVGDYNQLPPVQPVPPPKNLAIILGSLFGYYVETHKIPSSQLKVNYRSHKDIVEFTSQLGLYENLEPYNLTADRTIRGDINNVTEPWIKNVLDPQKVVSTIIHKKPFEIGVSSFEAEIVVKIVHGYYKMISPQNATEERKFWKEDIGIVAPHNAQGRLIIRRVYDVMTELTNPLTHLKQSKLMNLLKNTIYSVEKFQGSDREFIISSIGISDKDQLTSESEFIYNLNRFNVLTSRAKCKVILVASKKFLKFIPKERNIMEEAAHIRKYAYIFCNKSSKITIKNEKNEDELIEFRYK